MKRTNSCGLATILAAALLSFAAASCRKEEALPGPAEEPAATEGVTFRLQDTEPLTVGSRSLLTAADIETKKTSVTLAAYSGGRLHVKRHFTAGLDAMPLSLVKGTSYNVYAFVNMGDVTASLPDGEGSLGSSYYSIPSYSAVNAAGLPMTGVREGFVAGSSADRTVPVRRLFAKVTANLSCDWKGASITSVKICQMNGRLPLWGSAAIGSASDVFSGQDQASGSGPSGTFVFYVPENMQGTVAGITDPSGKSHEGNATVSANRSKLTYLEATVVSSGMYAGTVTYRSYLGGNATTDFNVEGNVRYVWNVNYHEDGLQDGSWKRDTDLTDTRYLRWVDRSAQITSSHVDAYEYASDSEVHLYIGAGSHYAAAERTMAEDANPRYFVFGNDNGANKYGDTDVTASNWSAFLEFEYDTDFFTVGTRTFGAAANCVTLTTSRSLVTGTYPFRVRYKDGSREITVWIHVTDVVTTGHELELSPASSSISVGGTQAYTAKLHTVTYTNGVETGRSTQTLPGGSLTWSSSSASVATVSAGTATGRSAGTTTITARYAPSGGSQVSATATLSVSDVITTERELLLTPSSAMLEVGYTKTYRATLRTWTVVNGVRSTYSDTVLSNTSVTWASDNSSRARVNGSGQVTAVSVGTVTITAGYTPSGGTRLSATASLTVVSGGDSWDDSWDDGGEIPLT